MPPKTSAKQRKADFDAEWDQNDEHIETDFEKEARLARTGGGGDDAVKSFEAKDGFQQVSMAGGGIYKGFVKGGKFDGKGELKFGNDDVYSGEFKDDYRHGAGVFTAAGYEAFTKGASGRGGKSAVFTILRYQGNWVSDKREGKGEALYSNGDRFSGNFKANRPHGHEGVYLYGDGRRYEGAVKMGSRDGKGTLTMKNNDVYTGEFRGGKIHGKGVMRYGGGANTAAGSSSMASKVKVFEGTFAEGKRVRGSMAHPDGKVYDGEWSQVSQKPHGVGKCTMRCGDVYRGEWDEGRMHGRGRLTYHGGANKGRVYDGEWVEDKPNGKGCMLLPNGDLVTCMWKDGKTDPDAPSDKVKGQTTKDLPSMDWYKKRKSGGGEAAVDDDLDVEIDLDDLGIEGDDLDAMLDDLDIELDVDLDKPLPPAPSPPAKAMSKGKAPPPISDASKAPSPPTAASSKDGWCDGLEGWDLHDTVSQEDFTVEDSHHAVLKTLRKTGKVESTKAVAAPTPKAAPDAVLASNAGTAVAGDGNVMLTAKVVHSGWLDKYSIGKSFLSFGNWKTRYFTLFATGGAEKGGFLSYYTTEQSDVELGTIVLSGTPKPTLHRSPTTAQHKKASDPTRDLVLKYTDDGKEYSLLLRCNTPREHDAWVLYLSKVVQDVV